MRYNRYLSALFWKVGEGGAREPAEYFNAEIGAKTQNFIPLDMDCSFSKSITSAQDSASVVIHNAEQIEDIFEGPNWCAMKKFIDQRHEIDILIGDTQSGEQQVVFSGDIVDMAINPVGTTDSSLRFDIASGYEATGRGYINHTFLAGVTYREIVKFCFDEVWEPEFGVRLLDANLIDPDGVLEKALAKPLTVHRPVSELFDWIGRGLAQDENRQHFGFCWGISQTYDGRFREGYFVDKRAPFDLGGDNKIKDANHETGLIGLPTIGNKNCKFSHMPDIALNIGNSFLVKSTTQIDTFIGFWGRVDQINANLSNSGAWQYDVSMTWMGDDGLAYLDKDRRNVSARSL